LYNKPQGCSTSVALATGPNDEEEEEEDETLKKSNRYFTFKPMVINDKMSLNNF